MRDLVEPGVTGQVWEVGKAREPGELLVEWRADEARRRSAGEAAAARARSEWTSEELAAIALDLYRAVGVGAALSSRQSPGA